MSDLYRLLNEARDLLDFAEGSISHDKAHCYKCDGVGERRTDAYDEPPEPCEMCNAREGLLGEIKAFLPQLEAEIHEQFRVKEKT